MSDSIRELYGELKQGVSASKDYAEYLKALGELDREMAALMEPDEHGWKMLDARRMEALAKKYRMAGMLAEVYLQNTRDSKDPAEQQLRSKVRKVSELMAADTAALRRYNPKSERELKSLPTVLEEARIPVMDQSSKVIKSVGGAQSSRFPMTIIGPDGKPMPGMFTKADVFDPKGMMTGLLNGAAAKAGPAGAALLSGFLEAYQSYYTQNPDEAHPVSPAPEMVHAFLQSCRKNKRNSMNTDMSVDRIAEEIAKVRGVTPQEVKNACGKDALKALAAGMKKNAFDVSIKTVEIGMEEKTRVDRKNAGMSTVAEMLGIGNVVCHARPMKLKGPDGKIVDETFMAMAEGVDPAHPGRKGHFVSASALKHSAKAMESIADLQVLDYVCGNVDRHGYNLFYQVNDDNEFVGVQGIDNDSSFGTYVPQRDHEQYRRLPLPKNMGVISKKTADRILALNPAELAFSLRGLIDEKSIDACGKRLFVLQKMIEISRKKLDPNKQDIEFPYLRELDAEGFESVDMKALTKKNNHFQEISTVANAVGGRAQEANEDGKEPAVIGSANRATEAGVTGQILKAKELQKLLSDRTSFWRGSSSQNYLDLENAVKDYLEQQKKLQARMAQMKARVAAGDEDPKAQVEQYVTRFDMDKMKQSMRKIQAAAEKYADEKTAELRAKGKRPEDDSYIKNRIDAARQISAYAAESQTTTAEERESMASNERRALEQIARTQSAAENRAPQNELVQNEGPILRNNAPGVKVP